MDAIPLCRTNALLPFIKFLDQIGSPTEQLLQQAKVPIFALADPEALIPLQPTCSFVGQAAQLEGIENLGILVGQQTQISDLGVFGHLLSQSPTLYDLLSTLEKMIHTYNSGEQVWMTQEGDRVWLHHRYINPPTAGSQQTGLYAVVLFLKAFQLFLEESWRPIAIHLQIKPSKQLADIKIFSNTQLVFEKPSSAIVFPQSLLKLSCKRSTLPYDCQDDYERLESSAPSPDFLGSLKQLLRALLPDEYPDIDRVAELTGISTRSLQRRLAENDLSYSHLVDQVRFEMAIHLLQDTDIKLVEIAAELGYADAANFTRAFKRWTGISPHQFRRLH